MAQNQTDPNALAKTLAKQIRDAAKIQFGEQYVAKTASDNSRRTRVLKAVVDADEELAALGSADRAKAQKTLAAELGVTNEGMVTVLKEASIQALTTLGTHWIQFFGALGI